VITTMNKALLLFVLSFTALVAIAEDSAPQAAQLAERLSPGRPVYARRAAAEGLGKQGSAAVSAVPALVKSLTEDRDTIVRNNAAWALGKIRSPDPAAIESLVRALADAEWTVRHNAALSLTWIGRPAFAALRIATSDADSLRAVHAVKALLVSDPSTCSEVAPKLTQLLADQSPAIRQIAANVSGLAAERGEMLVPALAKVLDDENSETRKQAIQALHAIGKPAAGAIPQLLRVLKGDKEKWNRTAAALALASIGNADSFVIEALAAAAKEKESRVRSYAGSALARLGEAALPTLQGFASSEDSRLRQLSCFVVGMMGHEGRKGSAILIPLLRDAESQIRCAAAGSLALIGDASNEVKAALESARDHEPASSDARAPFAQALAMLSKTDTAAK
jgi:HEAT repeat protein